MAMAVLGCTQAAHSRAWRARLSFAANLKLVDFSMASISSAPSATCNGAAFESTQAVAWESLP
jgi:hypothetical protein